MVAASAAECEHALDIELVPFRPDSLKEWVNGLADIFRRSNLVHIGYPFEGWGTSTVPGVYPGILRLVPPYGRTKLVTTLHEWRMMHLLRKASIFPLALASHGLLFTSSRERGAFEQSSYYRLRPSKPLVSNIPVGIGVSIPELRAGEVLSARNRLLNWDGVRANVLLGHFGYVYSGKQPTKMLRMLKALFDCGVKARLVIAGDFLADHALEKERFFKEAGSLGLKDYVLLLGFIEDEAELARTISACNVVLLLFSDGVSARRTSFWTVMELGVPLITTKPSFGREFEGILETDQLGTTVEFVDASVSSEELAALVDGFKEFKVPDQRRGISPDWRTIAEQHMAFYRAVLE
jgi:glycosyltransferase involved in cell wall biosynthesis